MKTLSSIVALILCFNASAQTHHIFSANNVSELRLALKDWERTLESNNGLSYTQRDNANEAFGYIGGAAQVIFDSKVACLPSGVSHGQIVAIFLKYADDHPDQWQHPSDYVLAASLIRAFPCKKP